MNRKLSVVLLAGLVLLLASFQSGIVSAQGGSGVYSGSNAFHSPVPSDAAYTYDGRLGTFRQGMQEWGTPVYRVQAGVNVPLVTITNTYSGRVEQWPIPTYAVPAVAEDGHLAVINMGSRMVYELFAAVWTSSTTISAGGMVAYSLDGDGVTDRANRRVTASGVANTNGMIIAEDFLNSAGQLDASRAINHALSLHIPRWMIDPNGFVAPAVGSESAGTDTSGNGVPMGARFALPRNLNVDSLNVHPFTREVLRAARDFGLFVTDGTGTPTTGSGQAIGTIEVEPGLLQQLYGVNGNDLISVVEDEVAGVVASYGVFRVTVGGSSVPMPPAEVPTQAPVPTTVVIPTVVPPVVVPPTVVPPVVQPPVEQPPVVQPPVDNGGNEGRGNDGGAPAEVPMSVAGSHAATASTTVSVGTTFTVEFVVDNAVSMYGTVIDCGVSSAEVVTGVDYADGWLFGGDSHVDVQTWADYLYYTVWQRSPVNGSGTVVTVTLEALAQGTATITCNNYAVSVDEEWVYMPFAPLTITVQ
jgi:hypothetical protein